MERGIPMSGSGKSGVHEQGTQAPASGKNTLAPGKSPEKGFNWGETLTTGEIKGATEVPRTPGAAGVGHEGGLANTPYRGPGYDPEKTYSST